MLAKIGLSYKILRDCEYSRRDVRAGLASEVTSGTNEVFCFLGAQPQVAKCVVSGRCNGASGAHDPRDGTFATVAEDGLGKHKAHHAGGARWASG